MKDFLPDYTHVVNAARNRTPSRTPLYEHIISEHVMEQILGIKFAELANGGRSEKREYFKNYCGFFKAMGYDTVSMERCVGSVMPGSGALGGHIEGVIQNRADFEKYPWDEITGRFFERFDEDFMLLREVMPEGMKAVGGVGNGVFEGVQELVGYMALCYISADDPELYRDLFAAMGRVLLEIWEEFLPRYGDVFCVCRFGDDLGFKSQTLIPPEDIRAHVLPHYAAIVKLVHRFDKPFLLHSCGNLFDVMDDIISVAGIDAKHSNEDQIADFSVWVERYGDRIGNFGGIDMDHLCRKSELEIKEIVTDTMTYAVRHGGFALGSGNSIPDYVPISGYLAMVEAAATFRSGGLFHTK